LEAAARLLVFEVRTDVLLGMRRLSLVEDLDLLLASRSGVGYRHARRGVTTCLPFIEIAVIPALTP
jgi:hypothetical protein